MCRGTLASERATEATKTSSRPDQITTTTTGRRAMPMGVEGGLVVVSGQERVRRRVQTHAADATNPTSPNIKLEGSGTAVPITPIE